MILSVGDDCIFRVSVDGKAPVSAAGVAGRIMIREKGLLPISVIRGKYILR
jgi:hypothetical protein